MFQFSVNRCCSQCWTLHFPLFFRHMFCTSEKHARKRITCYTIWITGSLRKTAQNGMQHALQPKQAALQITVANGRACSMPYNSKTSPYKSLWPTGVHATCRATRQRALQITMANGHACSMPCNSKKWPYKSCATRKLTTNICEHGDLNQPFAEASKRRRRVSMRSPVGPHC